MSKPSRKAQRKMILVRIVALFFALLMIFFAILALLPGCKPQQEEEPTPSPTLSPEATATAAPTPSPEPTPEGGDIPAAATTQYIEPPEGGLIALPIPDAARLTALITALSIPRPLGSPEERETSDFIGKQLEILGYTVNRQELNEANTGFTREVRAVSLTVGGQPIEGVAAAKGSGNGQGAGAILYYDDKTPLPAGIEGKILLMPDSPHLFSMLAVLNPNQKPAALLLFPMDGVMPEELIPDGTYPVLRVTAKFAKSIRDRIAAEGSVDASYSADYGVTSFSSVNLEASLLPEQKPNNLPLYILCAHYDSVYNAYGANDNASGVAALLEAARLMKDVRPVAEMRFVFFTGEEDGMIGSQYYAENLPKADQKRLAGVVNLDMFASVNGGPVNVYTMDGKPNDVSERFNRAFHTYFPIRPVPVLMEEGRSDHVPFQKAGFPSIMLSQEEVEGEYHSANDNPSIISVPNMQDVVAWVMAFIACENLK